MGISAIGPMIKTGVKTAGMAIKAHLPEICTYGGAAMTLGGTVWIGIVSKKANDIVAEARAELAAAKVIPDKKESKKAAKEAYKKATKALAKLYAGPTVLEVVGYGLIFEGHAMIQGQLAVVEAAYIALDKAYSGYRDRVRDEVGYDKEQQLFDGKVYDEYGNLLRDYGGPATPYTIFFAKWMPNGKINPLWNDDPLETLARLRRVEQKLADQFAKDGGLFLNRINHHLYQPKTKEGQIFGVKKMNDGDIFTLNIPSVTDPSIADFLRGEDEGLVLTVGTVAPMLDILPSQSDVNEEE